MWTIATLLLLLFMLPERAAALLQVRNATSSDGRSSAELNIGTAHPTTEFTYIAKVYHRVDRTNLFQTPIATGFGHTFDLGQRYIVGFDGSCSISCNWAIGDDGSDTYATDPPSISVWYCQILRRRDAGGGTYEQRYYPQANLDTAYFAQQNTTKNNAWSASTWIVFGAVPWTDFEGMDGAMENVWLFNTSVSIATAVSQCESSTLVDGGLSGNVFAHWPMVSDGNDTSGNARHLSLRGTGSEAWFDGTTTLVGGSPVTTIPGGIHFTGSVRIQ